MNAVTSNAVYQALQNLPAGVQIATGSYIGTGKYGVNNQNSLTFDGKPILLFIRATGYPNQGFGIFSTVSLTASQNYYAYAVSNESSNDLEVTASAAAKLSGNTISWYNDTSGSEAQRQLNLSDVIYSYTAVVI